MKMKYRFALLVGLINFCIAPVLFAQPQIPDHTSVVARAQADLRAQGIDLTGDCGAFRVTNLAVTYLRQMGESNAGILFKQAGSGCSQYGGLYAKDAVVYLTGEVRDVLIASGAVGGTGSASWGVDENRTDVKCDFPCGNWRKPIDPVLYGFKVGASATPSPAPAPGPSPAATSDLSAVNSAISALQALYNDVKARLDALQAQSDVDHSLLNTAVAEGMADLSNKVQALEARPTVTGCEATFFGVGAHCRTRTPEQP